MTQLTLTDISKSMRDIDVCMMTTKTSAKSLESRPMSNNRQVDYTGDSYYFTDGNCSAAQEIAADPEVSLSYIHKSMLGKDTYIAITGTAALIRDRATMEKHWVKDVEKWFKDGLDTPGITLIHVRATRIKYWQGWEEGEVSLTAPMSQKLAG